MFEVEVCVPLRFQHSLAGFGAEFDKKHEHVWYVTLTLSSAQLDQRGVTVDFVKFKQDLSSILEPFQEKYLNLTPPFDNQPPTAENIALLVAKEASSLYPGLVHSVEVGTAEERVRYLYPE